MKRLTTLAIVLLATINVLTFIYSSQVASQIANLTKKVENATNKTIVFQGEKGYTPVKGIDYNDGANGLNAMSYSVQTTVVKEVPLKGEKGDSPDCLKLESKCVGKDGKDGADGKDAPYQQIRINEATGDLESKLSTDKFWTVIVQCNELKKECRVE